MPLQADIRLMVAIPSAGTVCLNFAASLASLVAKFAADRIATIQDKTATLQIHTVQSSNWITNREKLARMALEADFTHLMFLDDDMSFDPRVLEIMLGRRHPIVVTNYLIKTEPAKDFVAVGLDGQRVATTEDSAGLQEIEYSGFGVSIFDLEVFKKTPQPWFAPDFNPEKSEYTTEDNPFFRRAREAGFKVYLDHDASKLVEHHGQKSWSWKEIKNG